MRRFVHGFIALGLLTATSISAQQGGERPGEGHQAQTDKDDPGIIAVLAVDNCFTSGSGDTFLKVCITENGNISWLESPAGAVHLKTREGYAICSYDTSLTVHGFDVGTAAEGWGAPTVSDNKRIITRTSLDGMIQLKQTFTVLPAVSGVDVKMEIKNLSLIVLPDLVVQRYFDADVDGTPTNQFFRSSTSAWGMTTARGLMLTPTPVATIKDLRSTTTPFSDWNPLGAFGLAKECGSVGAASGSAGDYVGGVKAIWSNVKPGQTKSLTLHYRQF